MNTFMSCVSGAMILWSILICLAFFLSVIMHLSLDGKKIRILISLTETVIVLVLIQILMYRLLTSTGTLIYHPAILAFINLIMTGAASAEIINCIRIRNKSLTLMTVKECMDELPVGICFYLNGGLTKLTNHKMDSIACKLTGSSIMNGETFCGMVFEGKNPPIMRFDDGTTYSFVHRQNSLDSIPIHELLAFDITEEYSLTEELTEKQKKAGKINARLKALHSTIQYIIMDRETLQIKMQIHDSIGKILLMTRHYLSDPGSTDIGKIMSLWRRNTALLKDGKQERWQTPCFFSLNHADSLGIRIDLTGELPEDETLISIVDSAITVHVTNVLRHAEGDTAYISSVKTDDGYEIRFTNNGLAPVSEIKETGGLANLRRRIEDTGGKMTIHSTPVFELILFLPEKIQEEY